MFKTTFEGRDAAGLPVDFQAQDDGSGNLATYHVMAPATYVDVSVTSLSSGQAAGTATVIGANTLRKSLMINPPADCILTLASAASTGWPLFGGVPNTISGVECPANALFVVGLSAGAALTVWEGS